MRILKIGDKSFNIDKKTIIMGVLNVTPDSFSDGGDFYKKKDAIDHAIQMKKDGADIIDIGGESTRPGSKPVSAEEELRRILPILEELKDNIDIPISIDTYKSKVAKKTLDSGASMINDISALRYDRKLAGIISDYNATICLMHMKGTPNNMQKNPVYNDVIKEIYDFLKKRILYAKSKGINDEKIIIDPGIGFGKRTGGVIEDNCEIIRRLDEFKNLGYPLLIGTSRKSFIGNILGKNKMLPVEKRLDGSIISALISIVNGADIIRVHDVKQTKKYATIVDKIVKKT